MAKKKAKQSQAADEPAQAARSLSLFPARPLRPNKAPGDLVELVTNLFRISLIQERPIYRSTIEIDQIEEAGPVDEKRQAIPRKISREIRQNVVKQAVESWLKNNILSAEVAKTQFSYVLDTNASTMFSLFDLQLKATGDGKKKNLQVEISIQLPFISKDKGLVQEEKTFKVSFHDGSMLNVRELMDFCTGKGVQDSDRYRDHVRALNVIFLGEIVTIPQFLVNRAIKTGSGTVFKYDKQSQFPISQGVICNKGFNLSVRPTESGLVLNLSNSASPFYQPLDLLTLLTLRFNVKNLNNNLEPFVRESLEKELKMKQVEAIHINYGTKDKPHYRKYRVQGISSKSTKEQMFDIDGKNISVFSYFKQEYPKVTLKYPNMPCIVDRARYIPIEICRLIDRQSVSRKLTPGETSEVIKRTAMKPNLHFKEVQDHADTMKRYSKSYTKFGLEFETKPIEVTGRKLPPIRLLGEAQASALTNNGEYQNRAGFVKPAIVTKWAMLFLVDVSVRNAYKSSQGLKSAATNFIEMYVAAGRTKRVNIGKTDRVDIIDINMPDNELKKKLSDHFEQLNSSDFIHCLVVIPDRVPDWTCGFLRYIEARSKGNRKDGCKCTRVSCLKFENFHRKIVGEENAFRRSMFLNNLWLKHNTKLGGVNMVLDARQTFGIDPKTLTGFLGPGFLFVSVDVCHPAPGDRLRQSIAAVVGMWNITNPNMSYCTCLRAQRKERSDNDKSTVEEVGGLGIMFDDILSSYRKQSGDKLPSQIVILRDGVSEGQFKMVLTKELCQVKQVLYNLYTKLKVKEPQLTCLTVQKRHKVRFMLKNATKDRKGFDDYNIQPGTVVDSKITAPNDFSFYLAPHKAIQGTSRAPHTYMIYDEIKFNQDSAQAMIFALSYLSPRCTKGTSIPTPINLADLAAERGKNLAVSWNDAQTDQKMNEDERLMRLNAFLSNLGEASYKNTLFYI